MIECSLNNIGGKHAYIALRLHLFKSLLCGLLLGLTILHAFHTRNRSLSRVRLLVLSVCCNLSLSNG